MALIYNSKELLLTVHVSIYTKERRIPNFARNARRKKIKGLVVHYYLYTHLQ